MYEYDRQENKQFPIDNCSLFAGINLTRKLQPKACNNCLTRFILTYTYIINLQNIFARVVSEFLTFDFFVKINLFDVLYVLQDRIAALVKLTADKIALVGSMHVKFTSNQ